jgi:hypothetical protein
MGALTKLMAAMTDHTNYLFFSVAFSGNEKTETAKLVSEAASKREAERGSGMWKGIYGALFLDWVSGPLFIRLIQSTHGPLAPWNNACALLPASTKKDKTFIIVA